GGFAIAAAARGAPSSVTAMDLDEEALEVGKRNAALNGVDVAFRHGDVFDALRALAAGPSSERPDLLIVDPAKWAKDRKGLGAAFFRWSSIRRSAPAASRAIGMCLA